MDNKQNTQPKLPPFSEAIKLPEQFLANKKWSDAARCLAVLRNSYPEQAATWLDGASAHIEAGELEAADTLLAYARQHFPDHPGSLIESATLAIRRQEWDVAASLLQQAREKHPDNLQTWIKSAEHAEGQGNLEQASDYYQKACLCVPEDPSPFIKHAELAMRTEQWEHALDLWEELRSRFPDISAGYLRAAEAARQLGKSKKARKLMISHQYGTDILSNESKNQNTQKQHVGSAGLNQWLELIWTKAILNLRSEVNRNYLSYGWWVLEPLLHMVVYYVVFGLLLKRGGEDFPVFLLCGLIPWMWFMKAVSSGSNSILNGQNLMQQFSLPSIIFPLISLLQATLKQLPIFALLLGFAWLMGFTPGQHWWGLVPVVLVQTLLTIAFTCAVAAAIPFARDLAYLVPTGLTFLMFLSGIFYDYRSISPEWQNLFLMNPMAFLLKCYREIIIDGSLTDLATLTWWGLGSIATCLLLIMAFNRLRYIYPRIVME